jgi:hypothetical protein
MDVEVARDPDIEACLKLLLAFRAQPETRSSRTFMDISGYPHYENVCTNILAFYFDPDEEHGLKDLLICAFLRIAGVDGKPSIGKVTILPQCETAKHNFIDLIIDSESFTIGIENKIHHWLANDLEDYSETVERVGNNKDIVIKAVLGLLRVQNNALLKCGFRSYTYGELWQEVRVMLGHYIAQANVRWVTFLVDFMQNTTNLAGENMELKKSDKFFVEYDEAIEKMMAERSAFFERLYRRVGMVFNEIGKLDEVRAPSRAFVWKRACIALELNFKDMPPIVFDLDISPKGWRLTLFGRNPKSEAYLSQLVRQPALKARLANAPYRDKRYLLRTWPDIETESGEIRDAVRDWLRILIEANAAEQH